MGDGLVPESVGLPPSGLPFRSKTDWMTSELHRGNAEALQGFDEAEARQLATLLTRLIANLDRMGSGTPGPEATGSSGRK